MCSGKRVARTQILDSLQIPFLSNNHIKMGGWWGGHIILLGCLQGPRISWKLLFYDRSQGIRPGERTHLFEVSKDAPGFLVSRRKSANRCLGFSPVHLVHGVLLTWGLKEITQKIKMSWPWSGERIATCTPISHYEVKLIPDEMMWVCKHKICNS